RGRVDTHGRAARRGHPPAIYNPPMGITPDTKDWTWVLQRACPECGFDTQSIRPEDVPVLIRMASGRFTEVLQDEGGARVRPAPAVWSRLEYACHVRDVFRVYDERLQRMLTEEDPLFANWDQDAESLEDRYEEQIPAVVSAELRVAADR